MPSQNTTPERPSYLPEQFWKDGAVQHKEFGEHFNQMAARIAAEDSRKLTLPKAAEEYKLALPAEFKAPEGLEFKMDEANPLFAQAKAWALKNGVDQRAFEEGLALIAGDRIGTQAQIKAAREAEIAKLGAAGPARVDALSRFFNGYLGEAEGKQVLSRVFTASDVQTLEKLVAKIGQAGSFTTSGREPPAPAGKLSDADFQKLSVADQWAYARRQTQPARAN